MINFIKEFLLWVDLLLGEREAPLGFNIKYYIQGKHH